ncbi:hypothetical protein Tco_1577654 [Tanacetum coccineum]
MNGVDVDYITRFHELARLVPHTVTPESKRSDRYIRGLASAIRGNNGNQAVVELFPLLLMKPSLESKVMRECCFVVVRDAWLRDLIGELTLSSLDVLQGFSFFLQMGFTLILATLDGLDVGLLGDVIGEDDCDDDG